MPCLNYSKFLFFVLLLFSAVLLLSSCVKEGCTDPNSINYNINAEKDDGSCRYLSGCTNPNASNYNPNAKEDDGSCFFLEGCTDPKATNYNPDASLDDGSCVYPPPVYGCTTVSAINYDPNANTDDGSCYWEGQTTFYVSLNGPGIDLWLNNTFAGTIGQIFYPGGPANCNLPAGTFTYFALTSEGSVNFAGYQTGTTILLNSGTVVLKNGCQKIRVL